MVAPAKWCIVSWCPSTKIYLVYHHFCFETATEFRFQMTTVRQQPLVNAKRRQAFLESLYLCLLLSSVIQ